MNAVAEIEEINIGEAEMSPFSPPSAYDAPKEEEVAYEDMHPFLQRMMDEHKAYSDKLEMFEETIMLIEGGRIDKEIDARLREFFAYMDEEVIPHNREEEKALFPAISKKMLEDGKHSKGADKFNVIDVLEDEHVKIIQMVSVTFNMFALFVRIPDERSRIMILDVALNQAKELLELLKLHIYREDTIIFSYAQRNLGNEELSQIQQLTK
jgi:hemerythrin-like domain-containing protein